MYDHVSRLSWDVGWVVGALSIELYYYNYTKKLYIIYDIIWGEDVTCKIKVGIGALTILHLNLTPNNIIYIMDENFGKN